MSASSENKAATNNISWKLATVGSVSSVFAALVTLGEVSPIITGLMLLAAVGWGFAARDNKREKDQQAQDKPQG
ncbi:ABC transporter permease [Marinobacter caseinilyticus]|uniref:ABC transporter permease n=1 Tax=Marinobacter caseinilyticus TaxID=2692195 RepID=UPI00140B9022|nr:ABC transporter permease [Marinobacter caseinilyticus]